MPTDKRKKHNERQLKKNVNQRTMEERQNEVGDIMSKLNEAPIPKDLPGIIKFIKITEDFIKTGKTYCGRIPLEEWSYEIDYQFINNKKYNIGAMLEVNPDI